MAKLKGKGVVLAGLAAGAVSFLRKKENRDKALELLNGAKTKATAFVDTQKTNLQAAKGQVQEQSGVAGDVAQGAAEATKQVIAENKFMDEGGAQTTIKEFNKEQQ